MKLVNSYESASVVFCWLKEQVEDWCPKVPVRILTELLAVVVEILLV